MTKLSTTGIFLQPKTTLYWLFMGFPVRRLLESEHSSMCWLNLMYTWCRNIPGQIVPLFGHLFKQRLHCSDTVMVFFRSLQVLLSLALQLVGLVTELKPGMAQTVKLGMFRRVLTASQSAHSLCHLCQDTLFRLQLLAAFLWDKQYTGY